jgi:hypothetical protein
MRIIDQLNDDPKQSLKLILDDGSLVNISLVFVENQRIWFYSVEYKDFKSNNRNLVKSPNLLREFRGILPFGLSCVVSDGYEPWFKDDFSTGRVKLYVLNQIDVVEVERIIADA